MRTAVRVLGVALTVLPLATPVAWAGAPVRTPPPKAVATSIKRIWRAELRAGAAVDPARHFANPRRATLLARIAKAARRYDFEMVRVEVTHPREAAPIVVFLRRTGERWHAPPQQSCD